MAAKKPGPANAVQPYSFTLILSGPREVTGEVEDALFEAGCDDALVGSRDGSVFLDFDREAPSFREAVLSAIADVEESGVGAVVVRVEPDELVTMSEIARRLKRSRENIRQLASGLRGPGAFPPPVANLKQRSPIWRWTEVVQWFREMEAAEREKLPRAAAPASRVRSAAALDAGSDIAAVNAALDLRRHVDSAQDALRLFQQLATPPRRRQRAQTRANRSVQAPGERQTTTVP